MKNKVFNEFNICIVIIQIIMLYAVFIAGFYSYSYYVNRDYTIKHDEVENKIDQSHALILSKKTDENIGYVADEKDIFSTDNFNDVIFDNELNQITKISGIKSIHQYNNITISSNNIKLYDNNQFLEEIKNKEKIYIVGYYDFQNIQHQGQQIEGIYLNHRFQDIVGQQMAGKTINLDCQIPAYMELKEDFKTYTTDTRQFVRGYDIQNVNDDLSFQIQGILDAGEYTDTKNDDHLIIYVPAHDVEQVLSKYKDALHPYQTRQYIIECQADKKDNITKSLIQFNDLYVIENEYINTYINDTKSLKNIMISSFIIVVAFIANYIIIKRQKRKKKIYMKEYKNIYNKIDILSINVVMLFIFVGTFNYYYIMIWLMPAVIILYMQYVLYRHFLYKDYRR